jgi:hypothetical protein
MSVTIAFCTAASVFQGNRILEENIAKDFPGALWVTRLAQFAEERGIEVVTGDLAIARIQEGKLKPSEVLVIQEENCSLGFELTKMGAKPFLLFSAESPLYARNFYAHLPEISALFRNRILFRGVFASASEGGVNHVMHFPSFNQGVEGVAVDWSSRRFMVMVAANKYWKPERSIFRHVIARLRDIIVGRKTYISNETKELQLHDRRLELIEYFGQRKNLDLFGTHWENINNLPAEWRGRLREIVSDLKPTACKDKHTVISNYKFAICFENMSYPGYVTEKIIDCFRAGVIPIYLGAPDIGDFIPKASFIDLREYTDLDELNKQLTGITEDTASKMMNAARTFLKSETGDEYSYEGFARNVLQMVEDYE